MIFIYMYCYNYCNGSAVIIKTFILRDILIYRVGFKIPRYFLRSRLSSEEMMHYNHYSSAIITLYTNCTVNCCIGVSTMFYWGHRNVSCTSVKKNIAATLIHAVFFNCHPKNGAGTYFVTQYIFIPIFLI